MPQGVPVVPQDQNGARFYGKLRRQQQTNWAFPASTTTPFSGNTPAGVKVWDAALSYAATQGATPTGEFELAEIHGVQLILANNNSGQTLSGITLQDWDEAPSSGLAIPGQSYSTAINLATGASVTLSALNLASGSAIRLWVPINSASLRFLVVNPTYAAAVTAGTGSLETIAIPEYGTVQLSGSSVPLTAFAPKLLTTIPYTDFSANSTYLAVFNQALTRYARQRTISILNDLNEAVTSVTFRFYDSTILNAWSFGAFGTIYTDSSGITPGTAIATYTSEAAPALASHVDSFQVLLSMGATAPTSGSVSIYLTEQI